MHIPKKFCDEFARMYRRSNPWIGVYINSDLGRIRFPSSSAGFRQSPFATNSDRISLVSDPSTCGIDGT